MNDIGKPERTAQDRVIALFSDKLTYQYLGDWTDRKGNSQVGVLFLNRVFGKGERC